MKKAYSSLAQTTNKAIAEHGSISNWDFNANDTKGFVDKYIAPYLNVVKNCGYNTTGDCEFKWANLKTPNDPQTFDNTYYKLILNDGTTFLFQNVYSDTLYPLSYTNIYIDINGQKGPNVYGKDIFLYIYHVHNDARVLGPQYSDNSGKFMPNGGYGDNREHIEKRCNKNKAGDTCAALIMIDGWQIKDNYPW